jgi:hypothetical protein
MIGEIQEFIERLKSQEPPPIIVDDAVVESDPWVKDEIVRTCANQAKAHRAMPEAVDEIEHRLSSLHAAGADDPAAIDDLDQIVAIVGRKELTDSAIHPAAAPAADHEGLLLGQPFCSPPQPGM